MKWLKVTVHHLTIRTGYVPAPAGVTDERARQLARIALERCSQPARVRQTGGSITVQAVEPGSPAESDYYEEAIARVSSDDELVALLAEARAADDVPHHLLQELEHEVKYRRLDDKVQDPTDALRRAALAKLTDAEKGALGLFDETETGLCRQECGRRACEGCDQGRCVQCCDERCDSFCERGLGT